MFRNKKKYDTQPGRKEIPFDRICTEMISPNRSPVLDNDLPPIDELCVSEIYHSLSFGWNSLVDDKLAVFLSLGAKTQIVLSYKSAGNRERNQLSSP
jgi:hypothetical protein